MNANLIFQKFFYKIGLFFKSPKVSFLETELLKETLNYSIQDEQLFKLALTHSSTVRTKVKHSNSTITNERLEFLGDAVLNLLAAQYLYKHYPNASEGDLTISRSKLVNKTALVKYAEILQLSRFLKTHPKFSTSDNKGMNTIVADAFEAIVGAIYLDGGINSVIKFIERFFNGSIINIENGESSQNYKSTLLEALQAKKLQLPTYKIISTDGPEHSKIFLVEVLINNISRGSGSGSSKKEAEQNAARIASEWLSEQTD